MKAKSLRLKSTIEEPGEHGANKKEEINTTQIPLIGANTATTFVVPDDTQKINELITIVQTHTGDQEVTIGNNIFMLNKEGIEKIQTLLVK